jgi:hypothetical protein
MSDPIIDDVKRYRFEHAAKFNFDLNSIFDDVLFQQKQIKRKRIHLTFKPIQAQVPVQRMHVAESSAEYTAP